MASPLSCGLAPRADRLGLGLLLKRQHPLEHREGCGLRLHRLVGYETRLRIRVMATRGVMNSVLLGRKKWTGEESNR